MEANLSKIPAPKTLQTQEEFDKAIVDLINTFEETIKSVVKRSKPCPYTKRWWTKDLTKMKKELNKLSEHTYRFRALPNHQIHTHRKKHADEYAKAIKRTKDAHWKKWLEDADGDDIWKASKYATGEPSDGGKTRIPTLKRQKQDGSYETMQTNSEKTKALCESFFPALPDESSVDPNQEYPPPITTFKKITRDQIIRNINKLKPHKAPGLDGHPNVLLKETDELIADYLVEIFNAVFKEDIYFDGWRDYLTVVLRKPGRPDYSMPKAFRPVALLNNIKKLLTTTVTEDLTYIAETYQLLPKNQFGGRPGRSTTDALHYLVQKIQNAWRQKRVVSVLFMDIEGAFPNAVPERLVHNMRMKGIPEEYIKFVWTMLKERRTKLSFDDFRSEFTRIRNGIEQGDPSSMILYSFYCYGFFEIPMNRGEDAMGFVDDSSLIAEADTFEETHKMLADMMTREGGALTWAKDHNSRFELNKFALIDFSKSRVKDESGKRKTKPKPRPILQFANTTITPKKSHKFLGVFIEQDLRWKEHE